MSKLDDLLGKKKPVVTVLDLSRNIVQSGDEFKRLMEKVPEYKMRPVKVRADDIKIKEKDFSFKWNKKEVKKLLKTNGERIPMYSYLDPVPTEMNEIMLCELCAVPIDWKMLTTLRPKLKQEEDFFSRMVEMGKLQLKTEQKDRKTFNLYNSVRKLKNKSGIVEMRLHTCNECGEEMCCGKSCDEFNYDIFARVEPKFTMLKPASISPRKSKLNGKKKTAGKLKNNNSK